MNTFFAKSTHAMALPATNSAGQSEAAPTSVHIMPAGTFSGRDGRGPYTLKDAQAVIAASLSCATQRGIPMDYDHQLEFVQQNGQPALASGWITGLEARADGIWADVEWTQKAAAHVAGREYRYLSPVFYHGSDGTVSRIESVALTNQPNFSLKALAAKQEVTTIAPIKENSMLKTLAAMLGLQAEASETAVQAAVRDLQEQHKALAAKAESPDPAKYISIKVFEDVQKELASLKSVHAEAAAASLVATALADGKISPAMQDWAKSYASKDAEGFKAWAALAPDLRPGGADKAGTDTTANPPSGAGGAGLTEVEKAIAAACGLSETDFAKEKGV